MPLRQRIQNLGAPTPGAGVNCAISGVNHGGVGAIISDYAGFGLGSSSDMGGSNCFAALGYSCAFGGVNPEAPPLNFLSPVGRSVYNGLQTKLATNLNRPFRGAKTLNVQVSYALSRFENTGGATSPDGALGPGKADQDYIIPALDSRDPNRYFGPSTLDRTHQLSFGGYLDLPVGFQVGLMSHFYSPLSTTLTVPIPLKARVKYSVPILPVTVRHKTRFQEPTLANSIAGSMPSISIMESTWVISIS